MSVTPKSMWPAVKAMLHSVYDQPDAEAVNAQFDRLLHYVEEKLPDAFTNPDNARADILAAPTPWASSPTATRSSASSAPSSPSKPTNGSKAAATSASASASTFSPSLAKSRLTLVADTGTEVNTEPVLELSA